jgi:hypothetical protein
VCCVQVLSLGEVLVWKFRQDDFILCAKCIHLAFGWVTNCCELLKGEKLYLGPPTLIPHLRSRQKDPPPSMPLDLCMFWFVITSVACAVGPSVTTSSTIFPSKT